MRFSINSTKKFRIVGFALQHLRESRESSNHRQAIDDDAEPPNNVVRYELIHGNYENKFHLNETSGELTLLSPLTKIRQKKQSWYEKHSKRVATKLAKDQRETRSDLLTVTANVDIDESSTNNRDRSNAGNLTKKRRRRADNPDALYTLTARAYDLGKLIEDQFTGSLRRAVEFTEFIVCDIV